MGLRFGIIIAALALSACGQARAPIDPAPAPVPAPAASAAPLASAPPPLVNGAYVYPDCEGEGGCPFRRWRAIEPTPVLAAQDRAAPVVATLAPGEWAEVELVETRLSPARGVVRAGGQDIAGKALAPGAIVYLLEYQGEGISTVWAQGGRGDLADGVEVDWEEPMTPPAVQRSLGLWAKVKTASGKTGWLVDPQFACMGPLAGDTDCRD